MSSVKDYADNASILPIVEAIRASSNKELRAIGNLRSVVVEIKKDLKQTQTNTKNTHLWTTNTPTGDIAPHNGTRMPSPRMAKGETKTPKDTKTDTKHHPQVTKGDSVIPGQMEGSERQLETKNPESLTSTPAKVQGEDPVAAKLGGVTKELAALLKATENLAHVDPGQVVNSVTNNTNTVAAGDANSHVANNSSSTNNQVSRISGDKSVSIGGTESTSNQLGSQPSKAKPAKQEASPFEGYWHDEKGQLRKSNGQYASKAEKEAYSSSQDAKDRNAKEKELSLIGKLVGYAKDGATLVSENGGKAEEATAVAAGGSYFYAAKELFDLGRDTVEQFGNIKESVSSKVESFRESHSGKDGDKESQGSEVKVGDQINKIEVGTKEDQASQKPAALHKRMAKMLGFPVPVGKSANPGLGQQKAQQPKKPRGTSIESQTYEVLREQSSEQQQYQATMLKEADDMIKAIKGIDTPADSGLAGSVMDSIGDLFEGKRGGRRKTLREKLSRKPKPSSVIEAASDIADSKGKNPSFRVKGGKPSMLSRIGGSLKASGGAGALAAVFAGYDKYTEMQQRTDLSTTQKGAQVASTAVGAGGGAMAGGAAGAALGSIIFPGVGTAIGGAIGAVLGGTAGQNVGDTIGQSLSNFIGSDKTITQVIGNAWTTAVESTAATASSAVDSIKGWFGFGDDDETKPATERLQPGSTESTMAAVKSQLALGKTFDQGPDVTKGMQHTYSGGTNRGSYTNPAMGTPVTPPAPAVSATDNQVIPGSETINKVSNTRIESDTAINNANKQREILAERKQQMMAGLDPRTTAALERLAKSAEAHRGTPPQPQAVRTPVPARGETNSIPADFDDMYLRRMALDMD